MIIIKLISLILVAIGVCLIYDARILTNIWFGFGDQNEATSGLKMEYAIVNQNNVKKSHRKYFT